MSDERKKFQKLAFDLHVDSDDEDADVDLDEQIEDLFKSKRSVKDKLEGEETGQAPVAPSLPQPPQLPPNVQIPVPEVGGAAQATNVANKLKMAKEIADKVAANRSANKDKVDDLAKSIMEGTSVQANMTSKTVAEQIAEKLNMKLNYTKQENIAAADDENFKVYEEELEINDFPQQARWRITSKETISHICEYAEVGITVRGTYFPPEKGNKALPLGERKLYLAIESLNEKGLTLAKSEISRIIKEEINKLQNPAAQLINKGRYKVT